LQGPPEEAGGGPTTAWGRINEKPLAGATVQDDTAFLLHAVRCQDQCPPPQWAGVVLLHC
jgi:hypothetical protein